MIRRRCWCSQLLLRLVWRVPRARRPCYLYLCFDWCLVSLVFTMMVNSTCWSVAALWLRQMADYSQAPAAAPQTRREYWMQQLLCFLFWSQLWPHLVVALCQHLCRRHQCFSHQPRADIDIPQHFWNGSSNSLPLRSPKLICSLAHSKIFPLWCPACFPETLLLSSAEPGFDLVCCPRLDHDFVVVTVEVTYRKQFLAGCWYYQVYHLF